LARLLELDGFHVPDFLTPSPVSDDIAIDDELDLAMSAPAWRVARDSRHLEPFTARSGIADALVDGDRRVGASVVGAVLAFHRAAYGDSWREAHRTLRAAAERRRRDLEVHGPDYLLSTIHPSIHWRRPVLTISGNSYDGEYERHGQGIVLMPGIGRMRTVTTMINPWEPVTIGYPIAAHPQLNQLDVPASPQLVRLLGRTRARVLVAIEFGPDLTTTELAASLGISMASASEHASTLRSAGLITSTRDRNGIRHSLLPLGSGLIRAAGSNAPQSGSTRRPVGSSGVNADAKEGWDR
jgi:DNA-binding MarR family transcriptional regulator